MWQFALFLYRALLDFGTRIFQRKGAKALRFLFYAPSPLAVAGVAQQGHLPCGSPDRATPRGRYTQQGFSRINTDFLTQRRKGAKTLRFLCYVASSRDLQ